MIHEISGLRDYLSDSETGGVRRSEEARLVSCVNFILSNINSVVKP